MNGVSANMKQTKQKFSIALFSSVILFLGILFYTNSSRKLFINQAYYSIQQTVEEKSSEIGIAFNYASNSIKLLSNFVSDHMTERELKDATLVLTSFTDNTPFNYIEYIRWDGLNFMNSTVDGKPFDASERIYYKNGIKGESGVWPNYHPKVAKETMLNFYTPLYYENQIAGVITGAIGGTSGIAPMMESYFFNQKMTGILCDEDFNVISSTDNNITYGLNLLDFSDNKLISDIIEHGKNKDITPFKYKENGKTGLSCVANVDGKDWKLIMIVLPKDLNRVTHSISLRMILILVFIVVILSVYLITYIHGYRKESNQITEKQLNTINALGIIYQNVYSVNIKTGELFVYRMSDQINSKYGAIFPSGAYRSSIELYIENEVLEEDKILFDPILDVEQVQKIFENTLEYSFIYRVVRSEEIHYFQCCLFKSTEDSNEFVACFKDVDQMMKKQLEDQDRLNSMLEMQSTQLSILGSLCGIYLTTHLIELDKDIVVEINTCDEVREYVNKLDNAAEQMKRVMTAVVAPEDLQEMLAFTNLKTVAKRMNGRKIISNEFLSKFHGYTRASFISIESGKDNLCNRVVFVTQVIDEEKRREQNLINSVNNDELTGLLNRHAYEQELKLYKNNAPGSDFVYVSMDVNGLKTANDTLGHEAGDELLQGAAICLEKIFGKYGKIFRTGGDEFQAIIFVDSDKLKKIKEDFEQTIQKWTGKLVTELRISAGYVTKKENPNLSIVEIIKLADQRMYKEKSLYYTSRGIDRRAQQDAYEVLCNSYTKVLKVNLSEDSFSIIQMDSNEKNEVKGYNEKISKWLHDFGTSGQVHKEDIDEYLNRTDINYIRNYFEAGNKVLGIQYRRKIGDEFHKVMMEMIPSKDYSESNKLIYLYVKNIEKSK